MRVAGFSVRVAEKDEVVSRAGMLAMMTAAVRATVGVPELCVWRWRCAAGKIERGAQISGSGLDDGE